MKSDRVRCGLWKIPDERGKVSKCICMCCIKLVPLLCTVWARCPEYKFRFVLVCWAGRFSNAASRTNDKRVSDKATAIPLGRYKANDIIVEYLLESVQYSI